MQLADQEWPTLRPNYTVGLIKGDLPRELELPQAPRTSGRVHRGRFLPAVAPVLVRNLPETDIFKFFGRSGRETRRTPGRYTPEFDSESVKGCSLGYGATLVLALTHAIDYRNRLHFLSL